MVIWRGLELNLFTDAENKKMYTEQTITGNILNVLYLFIRYYIMINVK